MTEIKGIYKKAIFKGENGYVIGLFRIKEMTEDSPLTSEIDTSTITFTGYFHELTEDDNYLLKGNFIRHPKYGVQFQVDNYERLMPEDKDSTVEFLSGGLFKGIGEKTAEKIVSYLGKDTLNVIMDNPSNLLLIPGITKRQIDVLHNTLLTYQESYQTIVYLNELGFSTRDSLVIYNKYKDKTKNILDNNIYSLFEDRLDITFNKIDMIALKNGIDKLDVRRVEAIIVYVINEVCNLYGHSYLFYDEIYEYTIRLLRCELAKEEFDKALDNLMLDVRIIMQESRYYLKDMFEAEENIVKRCGYLMRSKPVENKKIDKLIDDIANKFGYHYNTKQFEAIKSCFSNNIIIITGGPGTGKTTIINAIVELYKDINKLNYDNLTKRVALLAPTGRASKRISESTNLPASTIHRFLKWNKETNKFAVNEYSKSDVDFIIIDEFSMVDTYLFDSLLRGLKYDTKIVLVGDYNQLPSVGPGQLLKDMIESEAVNTIKLTEIYRQLEGSNIVNLAYQVNDDNLNPEIFTNKEDLVFYDVDSNHVMDKIMEIAKEYKDDLTDFQILAPMYKTFNGIDRINSKLQNVFNEKDKSKKEITIGNVLFREDDKVIQLTNMPDDNVFNGDIGVIESITNGTKKEIVINFFGNRVRYTASNFNKFKHAYAISIHKSQGSEFDYVLIPVLKEYGKMLYRKLVYTGITRSKKKLYLVGDLQALNLAIKNNEDNIRKTTLKEKLINNILNV